MIRTPDLSDLGIVDIPTEPPWLLGNITPFFLRPWHYMEVSDQPNVPDVLTLERNGAWDVCYSPLRRHGFRTTTFCLELLRTVWHWESLFNPFCRFLLSLNKWSVLHSHISSSLTCVPALTRQAILYSIDPHHQLHNFPLLWGVKELYSCCFYICLNYR